MRSVFVYKLFIYKINMRNDGELQDLFAEFKSQFTVRGGGRGCMVQGTVETTKENINLFFKY